MDALGIDRDLAKHIVTRDLGVSIVALGLCTILQLAILLIRGPSHAAWSIYVGALSGSLLMAFISYCMARRNWIPQAMHLFAWSGMAAIIAMAIPDMDLGDDLSDLTVFFICAGGAWLYQILGKRHALVYSAAALAVFIGLGWVYNQWDDVVPAILWLGIAITVGADRWGYNRLRSGVREWANGGRSPDS